MSDGFLLDTNVPSELTKPSPDPSVTAWVTAHDDLHLSVVSIGELREHDLVVVTRNTKDFAELGLTLIDPWQLPTEDNRPL